MKKKITNPPVSRGGRFAAATAAAVSRFSASIGFDWRLWRQDILGSMVHATMLRRIGLLKAAELKAILSGLEQIGREIEGGRFAWKPDLEDVHMNIEAELTRRVAAGGKLHTGRSRNDQVALDIRMWLRQELIEIAGRVVGLQSALVNLGQRYREVVVPGYTHLQRGQPVYLAHHLLAYVEMLERDRARLQDCFRRINVCPLGSGALAGSTLPLDRDFVARKLGFVDARGRPQISQNSMDAVSDRDFAVEFGAVAALMAVHLSRLSEDLILWASAEFNFIRIDDAYTTGSSLMPQKRNPDVAELTRGKSARVIGNLVALLTLLKGLPMTYNRDMQEDKERLFDSVDTMRDCLELMAGMLDRTTVNQSVCAAAAADPQLLATDLAEYLVRKGVAFRSAHRAVGAAVSVAEKLGITLDRLPLSELQRLDPHFEADASTVFDLKRAMARRRLVGSPGSGEVRKQLARWRARLAAPDARAS